MLLRLIRFALILLAASFSKEVPAGFCEDLLIQTSGYDLFGGDEDAIDREKLGDAAVRAGIHYLAIKVPISALPDILSSPYFPSRIADVRNEPLLLEPVGKSKLDEDVSVRLGGLNLRLEDDEPDLGPSLDSPLRLEANPNHNALLLYSPRIFSVTPWSYGNSYLMRQPRDASLAGQLCAGWSCVSSNSSDFKREQAFQRMAQSNHQTWQVRAEGLLPRYEILGILVASENQRYASALLKKYPGLTYWQRKFIFQSTFPRLLASDRAYTPEELYEVGRDINPSIKPRENDFVDAGTLVMTSVVTRFTPEFPPLIRDLVSQRVRPNLDKILHRYTGSGFSDHHIEMLESFQDVLSQGGKIDGTRVPALLPEAKLVRVGHLEVHTLRVWNFIVAQYGGRNREKYLVLFSYSTGEADPPADVPYRVWGMGKLTSDKVEWKWSPK